MRNPLAAKNTFEKQVEDQLDDIHGLGIKDFFFGEDTEAIEGVFVREKAKFLAAMDEVLHEIAGIIATQLNAAIKRIQQGRTEAERFFRSLSTEQQKLSQDAMDMFRAQYADLEASVDDKQAELVSSLVASYKENVDSLRATFDKLEEEASKNFLEKAADFVVGIAKAVYNLGKLLLSIVSRIAGMIDEILAHPIRFLENLAAGIKQGFATFIGNFDTYLLKGFFDWLRGSVGSMRITLPEQFDEKGLFGLATQLIGLNVQTFKEVVIRKLGAGGERIVAALEKGEEILGEATELFRILKTEGLGGLWTHLKEMILRHLSETFNRIKETVLYETIKKALMFIASLFTPVGAFIKAVQLLYAGLKFLMDNIERIAMLVNAFLDSLELAVKGDTGSIANKIITVLSTFIVIGIDFLAKLLNLGNLADKVRKIIQALRAPVIRAMEWLVDKLIKPALEAAKKAGKAVLQAGVPQDPNERLRLGLDVATKAVNALRAPVVTAALINPVLTAIKVRYGFKTLQPVESDGDWWVEGEINPTGRKKTQKRATSETGASPISSSQVGGIGEAHEPDERHAEEKQRDLQAAMVAAYQEARRPGMSRRGMGRVLQELRARYRLRVLIDESVGRARWRIHGEVNPVMYSHPLPDLMTEDEAVAALQNRQSEIMVSSLDIARRVIERVFRGLTTETPEPGPGAGPARHVTKPPGGRTEFEGAYSGQVDAMESFRVMKEQMLVFHVDVRRFSISEIEAWFAEEGRRLRTESSPLMTTCAGRPRALPPMWTSSTG